MATVRDRVATGERIGEALARLLATAATTEDSLVAAGVDVPAVDPIALFAAAIWTR